MMGKYAVLFLIIISGLGQVSEAATNVSACRTISSPGEYVLNTSLSNINVIWAGGYCISITSSDVVFDGNGKTIGGIGESIGVLVQGGILSNVTIKNLGVTNWETGIAYTGAQNGSINNNNASNNSYLGIDVENSAINNTITNNTANSNGYGVYASDGHGIGLFAYANNNTLSNNTANSNSYCGIGIQASSDNTIENSVLDGNYYGIYTMDDSENVSGNVYRGNMVTNTSTDGIYFYTKDKNISSMNIENNTIISSYNGIYFYAKNNNISSMNIENNTITSSYNGVNLSAEYDYEIFDGTIKNNTISGASHHGIDLAGKLHDNYIYDNNFNNSQNAYTNTSSYNKWNITKTSGTNSMGGPYIGGNFWAYPNGTGFSQTCTDANGDGICDSNLTFDANNIDYLPLSLNFTSNNTPPASVTSLTNINYASNYINWTWSDPSDSDLANVTIYLNGTFMTNVSKGVQYYNATGLSANTTYEISTRTVDNSGNINQSWVNHTSRTAEPDTTPTDIDACGIISSPGEYALNTSIADSGASNCIEITSNDVTFDGMGYTVDGIDGWGTSGIYVYNSTYQLTNVIVKNVTVTEWGYGIYYENASNGTIENNTLNSNIVGIYTKVSSNPVFGNIYRGNIITITSTNGIYFDDTCNNNISSMTIENNTITSSYNGIYLSAECYEIFDFTIKNNTISDASHYGINLDGALHDNYIYDNNFNNSQNAHINSGSYNNWNSTNTSGPNILGGPYIGGNFWAQPDGSGFSQTCVDEDGNGICDSIYEIDNSGNNIDYSPLTSDNTPPASITNLAANSISQTYINWTWSDPSDSDFSKVMIYLDGVFQINVSKGVLYYNAAGLSANTQYIISTRTVDQTGNINQTWKNKPDLEK